MKDQNTTTIGCILLLIIICIIIGVTMKQSSINANKQGQQEFIDLMKKDPSTWTKEEREYYNNFIKWANDN